MPTLHEGRLQLALPSGVKGHKFDSRAHNLSHAMKAVDFIIERNQSFWFVEVKDPSHPKALPADRSRFLADLKAGNLDMDLARKYRDSWLYMWASGRKVATGDCRYYIILIYPFNSAHLMTRTDALRRKLPVNPPKVRWIRSFVDECAVFTTKSWNRRFKDYPITIT